MSLRTIVTIRYSICFLLYLWRYLWCFDELSWKRSFICFYMILHVHLIVYKSICFTDFLFSIPCFPIILGAYFTTRTMMIRHNLSYVQTYLGCSLIFGIFWGSYFEMKVYIFVIVVIKNKFWVFGYFWELVYDTIHVLENDFSSMVQFSNDEGTPVCIYKWSTYDQS